MMGVFDIRYRGQRCIETWHLVILHHQRLRMFSVFFSCRLISTLQSPPSRWEVTRFPPPPPPLPLLSFARGCPPPSPVEFFSLAANGFSRVPPSIPASLPSVRGTKATGFLLLFSPGFLCVLAGIPHLIRWPPLSVPFSANAPPPKWEMDWVSGERAGRKV